MFAVGGLVCGVVYAGAALRFALREDAARARSLMFVSLAYLPLVLSVTLLDPVIRRTASVVLLP